MKGALVLVTAAIGAVGCADNNLSMSIQQMEAVTKMSMCVATNAVGGVGRDRGVLDVTLVQQNGYVAVPLVRNNLTSRIETGGVEYNSIQLIGANVALTTTAGDPVALPAGQQKFFYAAAGGNVDPGGLAPMFIEIIPAAAAHTLAGMISGSAVLTIVAEVRPVAMRGGDQMIGGALHFPVDLCAGCLRTTQACPLAAAGAVGGCFPQQDDPIECCTDSTGAILCGASAPVKTM
ncbi:MAG: hypothetical protein JWN44_3949 [Myxococcales bacterium]|nr:hypothetical protein [Myxococcales bacterium]